MPVKRAGGLTSPVAARTPSYHRPRRRGPARGGSRSPGAHLEGLAGQGLHDHAILEVGGGDGGVQDVVVLQGGSAGRVVGVSEKRGAVARRVWDSRRAGARLEAAVQVSHMAPPLPAKERWQGGRVKRGAQTHQHALDQVGVAQDVEAHCGDLVQGGGEGLVGGGKDGAGEVGAQGLHGAGHHLHRRGRGAGAQVRQVRGCSSRGGCVQRAHVR